MKKNKKIFILLIVCYIILLSVLLFVIMPPAMDIIRESLFRYVDVETVMIIVVALISCLVMLLFLLFFVSQKNVISRNDKISYMDNERDYLERQINDLNKKLVSTEDRLQDAFNLVFSSQNKQTDKTGNISTAAFLKGFGININEVEIQGDLAFTLTPFHSDFDSLYYTVQETCQSMKLKSMRGDEEYIANDILKHIIKQIVRARLVIAILDGMNPNVFYELGIVHSLNKPTILLAKIDTDIPFDLKNKYLILYENQEDLDKKLKNAILNILTLS